MLWLWMFFSFYWGNARVDVVESAISCVHKALNKGDPMNDIEARLERLEKIVSAVKIALLRHTEMSLANTKLAISLASERYDEAENALDTLYEAERKATNALQEALSDE